MLPLSSGSEDGKKAVRRVVPGYTVAAQRRTYTVFLVSSNYSNINYLPSKACERRMVNYCSLYRDFILWSRHFASISLRAFTISCQSCQISSYTFPFVASRIAFIVLVSSPLGKPSHTPLSASNRSSTKRYPCPRYPIPLMISYVPVSTFPSESILAPQAIRDSPSLNASLPCSSSLLYMNLRAPWILVGKSHEKVVFVSVTAFEIFSFTTPTLKSLPTNPTCFMTPATDALYADSTAIPKPTANNNPTRTFHHFMTSIITFVSLNTWQSSGRKFP